MQRKGFTLVEIVVAVAISTIVLGGTIGIVTKATESLAVAKSKGKTYSALTDAVSRLNTVRNTFPLITVLDTEGYDALVFTNSGRTAGILVGIADASSGTGEYRLDPVAAYSAYGTKTLAVQDMTADQTAAVLYDHASAKDVPIREESVFRDLVAERFSVAAYDSGALVDIDLWLYFVSRPEFEGKPKDSYPDFPVFVNLVL